MSVNPSPIGGYAGQFFDNNGQPLSGGKIYTYAAGTTTPQAVYTTASGVTPHSNPIVLDSAGRVPGGEIWLTDGLVYKFVIETSTAILIGTYDNITGVNSNFVNYTIQEEVITATAGQTVFNLSTINYTPGTNSLSVYIDGVNQYVGDSYLETDSNTVTFTSGVHVGGEVKFTTAVQSTTGAVNASIVAYDPPFTGASATTVQDKLSQYISVKDFGAVGDGVADDTAAIQAAIDATPYGTLVFPTGTYRITAPITVVTDSQSAISRVERHLYGYGAVIDCDGVGQAHGFLFSANTYPGSSYMLFVEGFTFGGTVTTGFISFPDADNFYENMLFERITTTNGGVGTLFYFKNGTVSNLGGVTIRKCSGGPNSVHFVQLVGSATYGQFDDFTIEDCFHLGTDYFLFLDGSVSATLLQYSRITRCFSAGVAAAGIYGANQVIANTSIVNFYAEPKGTVWDSIQAELIECTVENVVNTVANFSGKQIRVITSGETRDTQFIDCRSYNGITAPWQSGVYYDIVIAYPQNIYIRGTMERYFDNAVSYSRPQIFPLTATQARLSRGVLNTNSITAAQVPITKTLFTFTYSNSGFIYDTVGETYDVEISGQLLGGVTNFDMDFQLYDGTNTDVLATITTSTYADNRLFNLKARIYVDTTKLVALDAQAFFDDKVFTRPPSTYDYTGTVLRASNPQLQIAANTLDAQGMRITFVKVERQNPVSTMTFV